MKKHRIIPQLFSLLALLLVFASCERDPNDTGIEYAPEMYHSIPLEPFTQIADSYSAFPNGMNQQLPPVGTIPQGGHATYEYADITQDSGKALSVSLKNPVAFNEQVYTEGKVLYERFCGVCHGKKGAGDGSVAQHEAINPKAYNNAEIAQLTGGQIYHTIMMGKGVMGSYSSQISYEDRWKIVHYVETLQSEDNKKAKEAMIAGHTNVDLSGNSEGDDHGDGDHEDGEHHDGEHMDGDDHGDGDHSDMEGHEDGDHHEADEDGDNKKKKGIIGRVIDKIQGDDDENH